MSETPPPFNSVVLWKVTATFDGRDDVVLWVTGQLASVLRSVEAMRFGADGVTPTTVSARLAQEDGQ